MVANYSFFTLPATVLIAYYPHVLKGYLIARQTGKWNNVSPRENVSKAQKQMTESAWRKAKRCEAAHNNGLENFPIFATAVVSIGLSFKTCLPSFSFSFFVLTFPSLTDCR